MCLGNNTENETFLLKNILMENSKEQKILGVIIDNKLNLEVTEVNYVKRLLRKMQLYLGSLVIYRKHWEKDNFQLDDKITI